MKTTLFQAVKRADCIVCDGNDITTQIDGRAIGKPGLIMLGCDHRYTAILEDQVIEIDSDGVAHCERIAPVQGDPVSVICFLIYDLIPSNVDQGFSCVTRPLAESDLLCQKSPDLVAA